MYRWVHCVVASITDCKHVDRSISTLDGNGFVESRSSCFLFLYRISFN